MAAPNLALSLHSEISNLLIFLAAIWKVGCMTGLIAVPLCLIGNELWKLGRVKGVRRG